MEFSEIQHKPHHLQQFKLWRLSATYQQSRKERISFRAPLYIGYKDSATLVLYALGESTLLPFIPEPGRLDYQLFPG